MSSNGFSKHKSSYLPAIVNVFVKLRRWCRKEVQMLDVGQKFGDRGAVSFALSPTPAAESGPVGSSCSRKSDLLERETIEMEGVIL